MKTVKIQINQLGPIRDSVVELKPLVVLSGESGLGKSYVAILLHYIYRLLEGDRIQRFFELGGWSFEALSSDSPEEGSFSFKADQLVTWINQDIKDYMCQALGNSSLPIDVQVELPIARNIFVFSYKTVRLGVKGKEMPFIEFQLEKEVMRMRAASNSIGAFSWSMLLLELLRKDLFEESDINQTFAMVPGRGALLNVPLNIQEKIKVSGDIYSEFLSDWYVVRAMPDSSSKDNILLKTLYSLNGGSVELDSEKQLFFAIDGEKQIPISAAASSIKELAPLYLLLDKYPANELSILFEEPEAHLHPKKQIDIADFVVQAINSGIHMQITTHSDYFLRRINDRIFLNRIHDLDESFYKKTINEYGYSDLTLDSSLVEAYLLQRQDDGSVKVISQSLENGIPYESFYEVIQKGTRHSLDIQQVFYRLSNSYAK